MRRKLREDKAVVIILIYVAFSVSGLLLLKIGTMKAFSLSMTNGVLKFSVCIELLCGMILYLLALITSLIAMKTVDLSIFYPVSAGLGYILVCLASYYLLKEHISKEQFVGMLLILSGVIAMNWRR